MFLYGDLMAVSVKVKSSIENEYGYRCQLIQVLMLVAVIFDDVDCLTMSVGQSYIFFVEDHALAAQKRRLYLRAQV